MEVSRIDVGCGWFVRGVTAYLDDEVQPNPSINLDINFFDTANDYADEESKEPLGAALSRYDHD